MSLLKTWTETRHITITGNLLFCIIECLSLCHLCLDLLAAMFLLLISALLSQLFLLLVVVEYGRHVLTRLTGSWVVVNPKHLEHLCVIRLLWVVANLNRFCVITAEKKD